MIVYHPYQADPAPAVAARQALCNQALDTIRARLGRGDYLLHQPCGPDTRYEEGLRRYWGRATVIIVEHDVVVPWAMLVALRTCPAPICAAAYPLYIHPVGAARWREAWALQAAAQWDGAPLTARLRRATRILADLYTPPGDTDPTVPWPTWAHRVVQPATDTHRWVRDGEPWADLVGFGCVKIDGDWQRAHPAGWHPGQWSTLDSRVSDWLYGLRTRVHIHWPAVDHHHGCPCHPFTAEEIA